MPPHTTTLPPYPHGPGAREETATVDVVPLPGGLRSFTLSTTQPQRDAGPQQRTFAEQPGALRLHCGNPLLEALFAMAVHEAKQNSVEHISDAAYNAGQPIACSCFQTGELWHYVWTRDLSYAAHLALAWFDPPRVVNSLLFKTSGFREGVAPPPGLSSAWTQIVQDTGSGGSWPVSTDRVTWALGAAAALAALPDAERAAFAQQAYAALRGTLEADRIAAFDSACGLYGGEQSFLDWRVQSYAPWIVDNLSRMAASKALSTNVAHWQALTLAAQLANEQRESDVAARYRGWATDLAAAIDRVFWLEEVQSYASVTTDDVPPRALHQFDLLGTALVVLSGIAPPARAAAALARYPHAPFGAPVIAPQQPEVPVYHNRAIWPFVTAYELRAAAVVHNADVACHAFESLLRGAALNLSHMENLEWLSGKPWHDGGPVVNSRRQLWSVAGFLSAVAESVFGFTPAAEGLHIAPFLTTAARRALGAGDSATLQGLRYHGRGLSITLHLPAQVVDGAAPAWYPLAQVIVNGVEIAGNAITAAQLSARQNSVELRFGEARQSGAGMARIALVVDSLSRRDARVFAPPMPRIAELIHDAATDLITLCLEPPPAGTSASLAWQVFRDGQAAGEIDASFSWTDPQALRGAQRRCYSVEAIDVQHGHHSQPSAAACFESAEVQTIAVGGAAAWAFVAPRAGRCCIELLYDNHAGGIDTGITNAVKLLRMLSAGGAEVARGVVQMPHIEPRGGAHPVRTSTALRVNLAAGRYSLELQDFFNMSGLRANARYRGAGGLSGALNDAHIVAFKVVWLGDAPQPRTA